MATRAKWILLLLLTASCTTVEFVRKDLSPQRRAILRYAPQSNSEHEAKYRTKLNQQATDFCGGNFQIIKEYEALQETNNPPSIGFGTGFGYGGSGIIVGGSAPSSRTYHFVEINCLTQDKNST